MTIVFSLLAFILWGIWGFLGKLASLTLSTKQLVLFSIMGYVIVFPVLILVGMRNISFSWANKGFAISLLAGLISSCAYVCYYIAISKGEASRIVTITALYPIITCILSFVFLHEQITVTKMAGILCAVSGIVLLSL